jgi:group I intron endonuclease
MKMGCVYLARNRTNGKRYVGKTVKSLSTRMGGHVSRAKTDRGGMAFTRAIAKYGPEQFEWTVLLECGDNEELLRVERAMISMLRTKVPRGYNVADGGRGTCGVHCLPETRKKIGAANKGRKASAETLAAMKGRKASAEAREKMSAAHRGKKKPPHSAETRAKMSAAAKGRKASAETLAAQKGRKHSAETRAKMSAARKGKKKQPHSAETRAKISAALKGKKKLRIKVPKEK